MDIVYIVIGAGLFIFGGFVLGYAVGSIGNTRFKEENQQLNDKLARLTDRDAKGRFVKKERK